MLKYGMVGVIHWVGGVIWYGMVVVYSWYGGKVQHIMRWYGMNVCCIERSTIVMNIF